MLLLAVAFLIIFAACVVGAITIDDPDSTLNRWLDRPPLHIPDDPGQR